MILLPSRRRPEQLKKFFEACASSKMTEPGFILIDRSDMDKHKSEYNDIEIPKNWAFYLPDKESMGEKIQGFLTHSLNIFDKLNYIALIGDDHRPITPNWDLKLINRLNGWNFVTCNDCYQPQRAAGATFISIELIKAIGYIFPPGMKHLYVDNILEDLGDATGCWIKELDVIVRHEHAFRTGIKDETHILGYSNWENDQAIYNEWCINERSKAIERILELKKRFGPGATGCRPFLERAKAVLAERGE